MPTNAQHFLDTFAKLTDNNRDKGSSFERLTCAWLRAAAIHAHQFREVYLWREFAAQHDMGATDIGIDLVARTYDGEYCAIQCKFLAKDYNLAKQDIDSFFTASGKSYAGIEFSHRIIITTTANWTKHAETALQNQRIPCSRIDFTAELDAAAIDWAAVQAVLPSYEFQATSAAATNIADLKPSAPGTAEVDLAALLKNILPSKNKAAKKELRPHQSRALADVLARLKQADRGKLIMACGTGKTFTALKISECLAPDGGHILFLVPSLALLSQTLREWSNDSARSLRCFAVCSDTKVGQTTEDISVHDLAIPATTDGKKLAAQLTKPQPTIADKPRTNVIFATYHSIDVVAAAQQHGGAEFDIIICDEAHRTTGVEGVDKSGAIKQSHFTKVHQADYLRAKKRLYMTATPRIYTEAAKARAKEIDAGIFSMDDVDKYGEELHRLDFSTAVGQGLLSDYKVLILAVDERHVSAVMQDDFSKNGELDLLSDTAKIIGCWNGLAGKNRDSDNQKVPRMRRAVAFTQSIKASEQIAAQFSEIVTKYTADNPHENVWKCEVKHVDGTQNALRRNQALSWLKQEPSDMGDNDCHILSNVRCLSEGVDVPALDAVMFLNPRKSQVDVVQSVGRVMRKAVGKDYGYIILPIAIAAGSKPEDLLHNNDNNDMPKFGGDRRLSGCFHWQNCGDFRAIKKVVLDYPIVVF